jgi:hypothetical protein
MHTQVQMKSKMQRHELSEKVFIHLTI